MNNEFENTNRPPQSMGDFARFVADNFERRMNPVFEGHRTNVPGQKPITMAHAIGFGMMYTSPKAVFAATSHELAMTPIRSVGIESTDVGSYHLSAGDDVYYPFKGIIDILFD